MDKGTHIQFIEDTPKPKTNVWQVVTRPGGVVIGIIEWYSPWRKYCFLPRPHTVYEQVCLREIAQFCEEETAARKRQRELEKASA